MISGNYGLEREISTALRPAALPALGLKRIPQALWDGPRNWAAAEQIGQVNLGSLRNLCPPLWLASPALDAGCTRGSGGY